MASQDVIPLSATGTSLVNSKPTTADHPWTKEQADSTAEQVPWNSKGRRPSLVIRSGPEQYLVSLPRAENGFTGKGEGRGRNLSSPITLWPPVCRAGWVMSAAAPSPSCTHLQVFLQNRFSGISDTTASFCLPVPPYRAEVKNEGTKAETVS